MFTRSSIGPTGAIFRQDDDYVAFERILGEALAQVKGMRLLAYCLPPNHWHLVVWPREDEELSDFGHWLTVGRSPTAPTNLSRFSPIVHNVLVNGR